MAKILLVEDSTALAELVQAWLEAEHHIVESTAFGADALQRIRFHHYDVIVLDWGLPDLSGIEICKQLRHAGHKTPILMLTAKKSIDEKELGFDSGADDYLTKPFEKRELSARIKALLRRPAMAHTGVLRVGDVELDQNAHTVSAQGQQIHLKPKEFALLELLMRNSGQVLTLEMIIERVWSADAEISTESVRKHISRLRAKLQDKDGGSIIRNVLGAGYKVED